MTDYKMAMKILLKNDFNAVDFSYARLPAIEAVKLQIPQKVKIGQSSKVKAFDGDDKVLTYKCYPCPNCGKWIVANENHKYCEWCGQKLDWSEE